MRAKSVALAKVLPHMHKSAEGRPTGGVRGNKPGTFTREIRVDIPKAKKYIHRSSKYRIRRDSDKPRAIQINLRTPRGLKLMGDRRMSRGQLTQSNSI